MRDKLKALALETDMIDKIDAILKEYIKDAYIPKSRFDEINEAKKKFESEVNERDKQLEELKKSSGDSDALKKQIENLQADNKKAKAEYEAQVKAMKRDDFVKTTLLEEGLLDAKYIPGVSAYLPISDLDIDNTTSVDAFKSKIAEAKTIASAWFKSDETPTKELNGLKINDPNNKANPNSSKYPEGSYEALLYAKGLIE